VSRASWIAFLATAVALAVGVAVGAYLVAGSSTTTAARSPALAGEPFSLPLARSRSTLSLAKHNGNLLVGIAARPGGSIEVAALRAETSVPTGKLQARLDGRRIELKACGAGCSRLDGSVLNGSATQLSVRSGPSSVSFDLPAHLPPTGGTVFARALRTMEGMRSFRYSESLSSGGKPLVSGYDVQAPNRLRLRTPNGFRSVIIGRLRWDYREGRWQRSPFPDLTVAQTLIWRNAKHPRIVGRHGRATELAAFGLLPVPAWFRLTVEPSGRVIEAEMIAPSHFMVHRYSAFNRVPLITPPRRR
jgi:hypothetical protein